MDLDVFAGARSVGWFDDLAVDADVAFFDQPLDRAARQPPGISRANRYRAAQKASSFR